MTPPALSVVLTVVDGGAALQRCLTALLEQQGCPALEILVPWDSTIAPEIARRQADLGGTNAGRVRWIELGVPAAGGVITGAGRQHELFDRRRAAGLAAAQGEIVAIVEDRGVPRANWAATLTRLHRELPHAVIGGAVENGRRQTLNQAVYFCDFGRYQLPFDAGPRDYITDVNVSYKKTALDRTRDIWRDRYHEPLVHWALAREGEMLFLSPEIVVDQLRDNLTLTALIAERLAWGRLFGALRVRDTSLLRRLALIATAPIVPVVLFGRFLRDRLRKGTPIVTIARVSGAVMLLLTAWVIGETVGYLSNP
jgi:hypothetical protein